MMNMTKEKNESQRICLSSSGEVTRLLEIMEEIPSRSAEDVSTFLLEIYGAN